MTEEVNTTVWDDSLLVKTYDESVGLAREALARRLADSTNKREEENAAADEEVCEDSATGGAISPEPVSFKVGDYARATYVDGLDYEGAVVSINEEKGTCVIRYLGYENEQEVLLMDLLPTWGKRVRREQFLVAKKEEGDQSGRPGASNAAAGDAKTPKSRGKGRISGGLVMPPMPPVPPMIAGQGDGAEQDFVAMLTAWYMSGYYTGLYQGKKEASTSNSAKKKTPKK
ncbi:survival motor neuron protein [Drosophila eugracilis]|uniref:survival motor neuron protein n=1 Tax=Drosophila eugracilis TaxID=29029 RepID=UPI0007E83632|nr:survival motor neuron protein [Drosophila eugracilis]